MKQKIRYNPAFADVMTSKVRYTVLIGGAGSGKSVNMGQIVVSSCLQGKERWLIIRKFKSTIKNSVYKLISDLIYEYKIEGVCDINKTNMEFVIGESEVVTSGLDDPEKIKSIQGITKIWIEEATELQEMDFDQLDLRLRGGTGKKQIYLSFNPISEDHWIKKKFFDNRTDEVLIKHTTYKDNYFLDESYIKLLEERMSVDENMYRIYVKGVWGRITTGQEFYKNFRSHHVGKHKFISGLPIHLSFDFNVNPYMPVSVWQIQKVEEKVGDKIRSVYKVFNIDEIVLYNPRNTTEEACNEVVERYGNAVTKMFVYGDATGKRKSTDAVEHNYDIILRVLRRWIDENTIRVPGINPDVRIRKDFVNMLLAGAFPIELRINEVCHMMITDMQNVLEDADGFKKVKMVRDPLSDVVMQQYGHLSDTMDYFLAQAFKFYYDEIHRFIGKDSRRLSASQLSADGRLSRPVHGVVHG